MTDEVRLLAEALHAAGIGCEGRYACASTHHVHTAAARALLSHCPPGLIITTTDELARAHHIAKHVTAISPKPTLKGADSGRYCYGPKLPCLKASRDFATIIAAAIEDMNREGSCSERGEG